MGQSFSIGGTPYPWWYVECRLLVSDVVGNLQFFHVSILKMLIKLLNSFECIEIKRKHSQRIYEVNQ
jgi:hypothetical protein